MPTEHTNHTREVRPKKPRKLELHAELVRGGHFAALTLIEHRVWHVLFAFANSKTLECWPGIKKIAELANTSSTKACAALRSLADHGLVETVSTGGGRKRTTRRRLIQPDANSVRGGRCSTAKDLVDSKANSVHAGRCSSPRNSVLRGTETASTVERNSVLRGKKQRPRRTLNPVTSRTREKRIPSSHPERRGTGDASSSATGDGRTTTGRATHGRLKHDLHPSPADEHHDRRDVDDQPKELCRWLKRVGVRSRMKIDEALATPDTRRAAWRSLRAAAHYLPGGDLEGDPVGVLLAGLGRGGYEEDKQTSITELVAETVRALQVGYGEADDFLTPMKQVCPPQKPNGSTIATRQEQARGRRFRSSPAVDPMPVRCGVSDPFAGD